jgi:hypothetical protein
MYISKPKNLTCMFRKGKMPGSGPETQLAAHLDQIRSDRRPNATNHSHVSFFSQESMPLGQSSTSACLPPPPPPPVPLVSLSLPHPHLLRRRLAVPRSPVRITQISMDPAASASNSAAAEAAASRDVAAMLPNSPPRRGAGHRRAQSEILLGGALPEDLSFDADLGVVGEVGRDEYEEFDDEDEEECSGGSGAGGSSRMFEMFLENNGGFAEPTEPSQHPHQQTPPGAGPARPRHQHSMSMDGSSSLGSSSAGMAGRSSVDAKKAISDAKLAELALVDPKRAKR